MTPGSQPATPTPAAPKPLVRAALFTVGPCAYAWIGVGLADSWEMEPIGVAAQSARWTESAFTACVRAFRRLQADNPQLDIVVGLDRGPIAALRQTGRSA